MSGVLGTCKVCQHDIVRDGAEGADPADGYPLVPCPAPSVCPGQAEAQAL